MQPYFFPYLGYFDLINYSNRWIIFDTVQYIRHGWINRNRILKPGGDWQYITVPLKKHGREILIKDVEISANKDWKTRILAQLQHYKKKAPYFGETYQLVEECLAVEEQSISRLNAAILEKICQHLSIPFEWEYFSTMNLGLESVKESGDWAFHISEKLGAKEYVNPPGGAEIFDSAKFNENGIKLTIRHMPALAYECRGYDFILNLSIIDVLMWNSPDKVKEYLDKNIQSK
jgi:hypothetical protein